MLIKKISILLILGASSIYAGNSLISGLANIVDKAEAKKAENLKVLNYAFKQRMRTQWIARDALLISIGFNSDFYQKEILENANNFNKNFNKLISSKKDIDKAIKEDKNFAQKIEDVKSVWIKFYDSVKNLSKNPKDKEALEFISKNNIKLLDDIAYIFTHFMKSYQSSDKLEASMAHIKIMLYTQVGKPRMYINKIVKDRLLIRENINKKDAEKDLDNSIKAMDKLMKALKDGDRDLELDGTEDRAILEQLSISQKIWDRVKSLVLKKKLTDKELENMIKANEEFIKAQGEVVKVTRASNDN